MTFEIVSELYRYILIKWIRKIHQLVGKKFSSKHLRIFSIVYFYYPTNYILIFVLIKRAYILSINNNIFPFPVERSMNGSFHLETTRFHP